MPISKLLDAGLAVLGRLLRMHRPTQAEWDGVWDQAERLGWVMPRHLRHKGAPDPSQYEPALPRPLALLLLLRQTRLSRLQLYYLRELVRFLAVAPIATHPPEGP